MANDINFFWSKSLILKKEEEEVKLSERQREQLT